jgi:hypothetical protein
MSQVGFEPRIPVFEQAKTVHALARAATVIGHEDYVLNRLVGKGNMSSGWEASKYIPFSNQQIQLTHHIKKSCGTAEV